MTTGAVRRLALELTSPRGAANLEVTLFAGQAGNIRAVWVNGEPVLVRAQQTTSGPAIDLLLIGLPVRKKMTLTIESTAGSPLRLLLFDQSVGLPLNLVKTPRPPQVVPEQGRLSNLTIINKMYRF